MFGLGSKKQSVDTVAPGENLASNLHDEKALSEIILSAIDDGVVLIDTKKVIQLFNSGAEKITGWAAKDAVGLDYKSVFNLVNSKNEPYSEDQNPFERIFTEIATIRDNKANLMTSSNHLIAINLNVSPLINHAGEITGAVGVFLDVTEERKAEAQRAEFISTASHEMRTPVAAIEGYLALAMNERVARIDQKARDYLEKAHASTQHLGKLFQDLLTSAKAEDGRLQNHPIVIEVGDFLQQLTEDMRFTAEKKGLSLDYIIGASTNTQHDNKATGGQKMVRPLYYTHADPERIREVLVNLFDNAIKYTETGKISVGLTGDDKIVQIRISDTGQGIPKEDIAHLFEKFYRVDNTATRTIGGTGLGLFICRKIIELYNGRIWVESEYEKGSTFYINLPRLTPEKAQELQVKEATENVPVGVTKSGVV